MIFDPRTPGSPPPPLRSSCPSHRCSRLPHLRTTVTSHQPSASTKTVGLSFSTDNRQPTCNLLDGPSEPLPRADKPEAERIRSDDAHGDDGVVQRLRVHGVRLRQDEGDGDEQDPQARDDGDRVGEGAEVEGAALEPLAVYDAESDRDA